MKTRVFKIAKIGFFFGVGFLLMYLVYQNQNSAYQSECALANIPAEDCSLIKKVMGDITNANFYWVGFTMLLFLVTNWLRALRWRMMLKAINYDAKMINLFGTIMIGYLVNLGIPRSGEVVRAGLFSKYEDIPVEKVLGTIFTDRVFDVIMLFLVICLAIAVGGSEFIAYLDTHIDLQNKASRFLSHPVWIVGFAIVLCTLVFMFWRKRNKIKQSNVGRKIMTILNGFKAGVLSVKDVSSIALFIFYTIAIWVIYYFTLYFVFFSFQPTAHLGPKEALVTFVFGSLGILIPSPGGMGSYHFLVGEALNMYGVSGTDAFTLANIVFFSIQIFVNMLLGAIFMIILATRNRDKI